MASSLNEVKTSTAGIGGRPSQSKQQREKGPRVGPGVSSQELLLSGREPSMDSTGLGQSPAWHRGAVTPVTPKLAQLRNKGLQKRAGRLPSLRGRVKKLPNWPQISNSCLICLGLT